MRALLTFLFILPLVYASIVPFERVYSVDSFSSVQVCASVYSESNISVSLSCNGDAVGSVNVPSGYSGPICFRYRPARFIGQEYCRISAGKEDAIVRIDVFPHTVVDALLALILVVLVVRFTVKLVKIML